MKVMLYSDGSSRGNPGPGGFGTILQYTDPKGKLYEKTFAAGYKRTTNNRMELLGVITGLEALNRPCEVVVTTDSQYVAKAFTEHWIEGWVRRGWVGSNKKKVKNRDLWKRLLEAMKDHQVEFVWVKGHNGHPENERCDELATGAADGEDLLDDPGFTEEEDDDDSQMSLPF